MLGPVSAFRLKAIFEKILDRPIYDNDDVEKDIEEVYKKVVLGND